MKEKAVKIKEIIFRFTILVILIISLMFVFEKVIEIVNKNAESQDSELIEYCKDYKNIVNQINDSIIQVGFWNYEALDYTVINYGEKIMPKTNKKRILVVGDSFVWGWAQDNLNNLWWRQLAYYLKKQGYQDVEIIAAGMNGFSLVDETEKIILNEEYINYIQPDLILVGFVYNDWEIQDARDEYYVEEISDEFNEQEYINKKFNRGILSKMQTIFPNVHQKIIQLLMKKEYHKEEFKQLYGYSYEEKKKLYLSDEYLKRVEKRAIEPLSKLQIPLLVVNFPFDETYAWASKEYQEKVFDLLDQYNIANYDMRKEYDEKFGKVNYKTELQVTAEDYHPNARLMHFYCEEINKLLQQNYPEILGEQTEKLENVDFLIQYTLPSQIGLKKIGENEYEFDYQIVENMLFYPYTDEKYIKLNLQYPTDIENIHIQTQNADNVKITVDLYNDELGYEDEKTVKVDLSKLNNKEYLGKIVDGKKVTSINISAQPSRLENSKIRLKVEE